MKTHPQADIFVGRRKEVARLIASIRDRRSMVIHGPPDSGKTALISHVLSRLSPGITNRCLRVSAEGALRPLIQQQVISLFAAGDPVVQEAYREQGTRFRTAETWIRKQTGGRLRSLLFRALDQGRYWIFVDNVSGLGFSHFHLLRELIRMRETPVSFLTRGLGDEYLGPAGRLFWSDAHKLALGPLAPGEAAKLLRAVVERQGLQDLDINSFQKAILEFSRGLPGAIVEMAAMARQPQYRFGSKIKSKLLYTDYLVQLASRVQV